MSREIIEALRQIEKEKGIAFDTLMSALEDALHSAYKKSPGAVDHAKVEIDPETGEMRVFQLIFPDDIDVESLRVLNEEGDEIGLDLSGVDESHIERARGHPRQLRPHRRPDGQAGDPAAHPRGRARPHVRRVRRPRGRARHRRGAAERQPLHARRAGPCRGPAAAQRADRGRALRARRAHQGRHHQGAELHQGPAGDPLAAHRRPGAQALRARGAGDRRRAGRDPERRPRAGLPLQDRGVSHADGVDPVGACVGRAARACAWS